MNDKHRIQEGKSISLYDELVQDRPEISMRRIKALEQSVADRFAEEIGWERLEYLMKHISSKKIAESLMKKTDEEMTDEDWADLRATDF